MKKLLFIFAMAIGMTACKEPETTICKHGIAGTINDSLVKKFTVIIGGNYLRVRGEIENPFAEMDRDTLIVVDSENGYVQYIIKNFSDVPRYWSIEENRFEKYPYLF